MIATPVPEMRSNAKLWRAISLVLAALLATALAAAAAGALPRTVTSVALISWNAPGGATRQLTSNSVAIEVSPAQAELRAFRFSTSLGGSDMILAAPRCRTTAGNVTASLSPVWQQDSFTPARLEAAPTIRAGYPLLFSIRFVAGNRDPGARDKATAIITGPNGDREEVEVEESAVNSGEFNGFMQTRNLAAGQPGDCELNVSAGQQIRIAAPVGADGAALEVLDLPVVDDVPGSVTDAATGLPLSGVRLTLVFADTGAPALVFGSDGRSVFPGTIVSGGQVSDASGATYNFAVGAYAFPIVPAGRYRIMAEAPAPYLARPENRADGAGGVIELASPSTVAAAIALDSAATAGIDVDHEASQSVAGAGDLIQYRVNLRNLDSARPAQFTLSLSVPAGMRLRPDSARLNGAPVAVQPAPTGFSLATGMLAGGGAAAFTYVLEVRPDARAGPALAQAVAEGALGQRSGQADAVVRIRRDTTFGRMTVFGRVSEGGCGSTGGEGVGGVRIMLEDGSYAVTDADGSFHFDGLEPGLHVVQVDDDTLPADRVVADCFRDTRSAGRPHSRFVEAAAGALVRADFRIAEGIRQRASVTAAPQRVAPPSDAAAAGAERQWLEGEEPGIAFLFPEADHNPRAPAIRVAVKHLPGQSVRLLVDGRPVDPVAFDGARRNQSDTVAVSLWRGVPIEGSRVRLVAEVIDENNHLVETLRREIHYSRGPVRATLLRDRSLLIADGVTRPVIALRLTDRDGRPVRHGLTGDFEVPAPYYPAAEADAQQARQLAGLERARPFWRVEGDEGVAYVELEPTTASGGLNLQFNFRDGEMVRRQRIEAWLDPGQRPWTIVGLAQGSVGFNRIRHRMETLAPTDESLSVDGRVALYATGRIRGRWLLTLAYDSDHEQSEARFGGAIDPEAYYTVYADRSERRFGAASVRRLYLRLERPQFNALFGDYDTGFNESVLARYVRSLNGVRAEYRSERIAATAFAADTPTRHRREEIQGNGLTGPYALAVRDILANSERVTLEVRGRSRSDRIVESRLLSRHIDYDIDYVAGTLRFREPILSRSSDLDPQFIVVDYEVEGIAGRELNAGARVSWQTSDERLRVGATALHDEDGEVRTRLVGGDLRFQPSPSTEIRAEIAVSRSDQSAVASAPAPAPGTATAWQVEVEHHGPSYDVLAYARERDEGFGLRQLNVNEQGSRRFGFDGRLRLGDRWSLTVNAWAEDYAASDARRNSARAGAEYRSRDLTARAGIILADDRLYDGRQATSTLLSLGLSKRFMNNRLETSIQSEIALDQAESVDFPARHRIGARFDINSDVQLIGGYEIADGDVVRARTARVGFNLRPWAGARIALTGNRQEIDEYGPRSFAAYGLAQSLVLGSRWSVDFTLDGNRTLDGLDPARVLNPLHPVASGGFVGGGELTEDFTAVTLGTTYRQDRWSATGRAEYRIGDQGSRYGLTAALLRQIGEGRAVGAAFNWFEAEADNGARSRTIGLQASWAHRPAGARLTWLDRLDLREDSVWAATAGQPGPLGLLLTISGDARSRRIVNSLSVNWTPNPGAGLELSGFWGARHVSQSFGADDFAGWSHLVGADLRYDISRRVDIGGAASLRTGANGDARAYAVGMSVGVTPFENGWLSVGWNLVGFDDRDFAAERQSRAGPYVTMRVKFDQLSLQSLGLSRR